MYAILVAAFNYIGGFFLRGVVLKFVILSMIYYVVAWIAEGVLGQLDVSPLSGLQSVLDALPQGVLYLMGVFRLDLGIPLMLGAMLTAFIIRRLPIIG